MITPDDTIEKSSWHAFLMHDWLSVGATLYVFGDLKLNEGHFVHRRLTQLAWDVDPMLVQCWSTVCDAGPTLNQHWFNVWCLLVIGIVMSLHDFTS